MDEQLGQEMASKVYALLQHEGAVSPNIALIAAELFNHLLQNGHHVVIENREYDPLHLIITIDHISERHICSFRALGRAAQRRFNLKPQK